MKYSFLLPFYNRVKEMRFTFNSFLQHYPNRSDYEIIIVEDLKTLEDTQQHNQLLQLLSEYSSLNIKLFPSTTNAHNPSRAFNIAKENASGEFLILTNPECMHSTNVLSGLDEEFNRNKNIYIICACRAMNHQVGNEFSFMMWYQHSQHNNRRLHFCTAISRDNWGKAGGFNEAYLAGCMFDDDDWLQRVKLLKIPIILRDDLLVDHIEHDRGYQVRELIECNRKIYNEIWGGR